MFSLFKKESAREEQRPPRPNPGVTATNETANNYFDVAGAGKIEIGKNCNSNTGKAFGFTFGVSWGRFGYSGGVLDREDAKKMADFIISEYEKVTPEQKQQEQQYLIKRTESLKSAGFDV